MPWGWECRERLVKQKPIKFTKRDRPISLETCTPGPDHYEPKEVVGKQGYSKIKRLPAYSFGILTKPINKPAATKNAPLFSTCGMGPKGVLRIPGGIVTPQIDGPPSMMNNPGPGAYAPRGDPRYKRPPAYSVRQAARPPYQPWDQWTPPPNMYCPPIPDKKPPAYTFGQQYRNIKSQDIPGPGTHEPNFDYVKKTKLAFSFGAPFRPSNAKSGIPAPNTYCEKKFKVIQRSLPGQSFGIRHSPFLGVRPAYVKPPNLDMQIKRAT